MDEHRLTKHIFLWDYRLSNNNWNTDVKSILYDLNLGNYYDSQQIVDNNTLAQRINVFEETSWKEICLSKPTLRTYNSFKENLAAESYIQSNLNRKVRSIIAQLLFYH